MEIAVRKATCLVAWLLVTELCSVVTVRADPILDYGPIAEPVLSANFNGNFAAFVAHRTIFGIEVNAVQLVRPGFPLLDLSDAFFGTAAFPDPPAIDMGPLETGIVSAAIPASFFPALATGRMGYHLLFTDTDDGLFAIDFLSLTIVTSLRTIEAVLNTDNGFGIGIPHGGVLPAPLPDSIPFNSTGTGFDETISSKVLQADVPEPGAALLLLSCVMIIGCCRSRRLRGLLCLSFVLWFHGIAEAADCPPPEPRDAPVPIPGKKGETGWLVKDVQVDDKGNKVEKWCVQGLQDANGRLVHHGPEFGWLWRPKGAKDEDAVWIAGCFRGAGKNKSNKGEFVDANKNGKQDEILSLGWQNVDPPDETHPDAPKEAWYFLYIPATGKLTVTKVKGKWKDGVFVPESTEPEDTYDAPKDFKDLKWKDELLSSLFPGLDGLQAEAFAALSSVSGTNWNYRLFVSSLGGTGTTADPFIGFASALHAGDTFTISGAGIHGAFVTGTAALPQYGGWVVDSSGSTFASFRATSSATLLPGVAILGFGFSSSSRPGMVFWNVATSDPANGSTGIVPGPAAPPDQLHILGPVPNRVPAGQGVSITANVQAAAVGVPVANVSFTLVAGNVAFIDGTVSADRKTSTVITDGNGTATLRFIPQGTGLGMIKVSVSGTNLNAYALFFVQ